MTVATEGRSVSRLPLVAGAGLLVVLVVIGLIAGDNGSSGSGPALSPSSTSTDGTRGLVLLLQEVGADVRVGDGLPDDRSRVALLLHDGLSDADRGRLRAWVAAGGTLVVADPSSPLSADQTLRELGGSLERGRCTMPELDGVDRVDVAFAPALRARGEPSCFGDADAAFVVSTPNGSGHVVSLGGPQPFTNGSLDTADNSVLAARLLAPSRGTTVAILDPNPPGSGRTTLGDLIADRVFQAILQLGVAFVIYALWRSRRIGNPVTEKQPVAIAGSQFVRAVGGLHQRSHAASHAADALRMETRRVVCERYGIPLYTDVDTLATATAARTNLDRATVVAALGDTPILDEGSLVTLGHTLDAIRQEVLDGRVG